MTTLCQQAASPAQLAAARQHRQHEDHTGKSRTVPETGSPGQQQGEQGAPDEGEHGEEAREEAAGQQRLPCAWLATHSPLLEQPGGEARRGEAGRRSQVRW